jgi:predicted dehydrogenase
MTHPQARWGLLSTARINERFIPAVRASGRGVVLGVASRDRATAEQYARQWDIPRAYAGYDAMLADPEIDVVYLPLPNHLHVEWAIKCAEAGKHVLCEKPLALTPEEVERMMQAAQRSGVVIQEAAMMRFHAQTRYLRDLVAQRAIGEVRLVRGIFTFTLERDEDIRWNPAMGGGSLWDLGSYCVSFSRSVLQAEPVEVLAMQTPSASGVDLHLSAQLRFPDEVFVHFFSSFGAFPYVEGDLLGTTGRISLDMPWVNHVERPATVHLVRYRAAREKSTFGDSLDDQIVESQTFPNVNAYRDEAEAMAATVLEGAPPTISLTDSWNNARVINALYQSARENRLVRL